MKKIVIVAFFVVLGTVSVRAQYSDMYYHVTGDTIEWKAPNGYYSWWEFKEYYENNLTSYVYWMDRYLFVYFGSDTNELLMYYYTPVPLKIIGIAGACFRGHVTPHPHQQLIIDTDDVHEYFLIYDAIGDSFPLVGRLQWNPFDPHRTLHVITHNVIGSGFDAHAPDSCCTSESITHQYAPIYEYYFDSAIYVSDSFYVGGSFYGNCSICEDPLYTSYYSVCTHYGNYPCNTEYQSSTVYPSLYGGDDRNCQPLGVKLKHKKLMTNDYSFSATPWSWHTVEDMHLDIPMFYPLIEVDTTVPPEGSCIRVGNVQAVSSGTSATVSWDYFPNYTAVYLRYGLAGHPQSLWTTVDVTDQTVHTLADLEPSMLYGVTLQAVCDKDEMAWSDAVYFYSGIDTTGGSDTTGISVPTLLSAQTFLQPNPARDEVTIASSFSLTRIEMHDAAGVLVYSESAVGHQKTLNIDFLRSGTYIVTIQTQAGTTHKKLVVQR